MNNVKVNFLKLLVLVVSISFLPIPSQADPACRQSFNVNPGKIVPANIVLFGGMGCQELESFRGKFYIEGLSHISSHTFDDFEKWKAVRDKVEIGR
uniref:hypothetical protein n=1 Tax=Candidatus Electrothrix sp. TaxID=2170559 RepID=UPI0040570531